MQVTSHQAQAVIDGAAAKALELGLPVIVAVLDAGAHLKAFRRMDGAVLASIDIAISKARTAVLFQANSEAVWEYCKPGAPAPGLELTNGGLAPFGGGIPSGPATAPHRRPRRLRRHGGAGRRSGPGGPRVLREPDPLIPTVPSIPSHSTQKGKTMSKTILDHRRRFRLRQGRGHRHGQERPHRDRHRASLARRSRRCARKRRSSA